MAHPEQLAFVAAVRLAFPGFFNAGRALEVGSLDINGSIRGFFDGNAYIGIDVAAGPGVDTVCQGQDYDAPDDSFDTVISCEVMEHNPFWAETIRNMIRVCRPGGLVVMTCATTGRPEHGTTRSEAADSPLTIDLGWEYYRNLTEQDIRQALPLHDLLRPVAFFSNLVSHDLYLIGFKRGGPAPVDAKRKIAALRRHYRRVNLRVLMQDLKKRLLIRLVGEERYYAGPGMTVVNRIWFAVDQRIDAADFRGVARYFDRASAHRLAMDWGNRAMPYFTRIFRSGGAANIAR